MKSIKYLFATVLISSSVSMAATDGGGGVIVCTEDKCITFAEAGFRFANPEAGIEVDSDVIAELTKIASLMPKLDYNPINPADIIGEPGDIRFVFSVNNKASEKFLKPYKNLLKTNANQPIFGNLGLPGFTVQDPKTNKYVTYIIEDKYRLISTTRSRALLLIHEYNLRVRQMSLNSAIKFDGALVDYLQTKESNKWDDFDSWNLLSTVYGGQTFFEYHAIGDIIHRNGNMEPGELFTTKKSLETDGENAMEYGLNYMQILQNRKYDARFSTYFKPGKVLVKIFSLSNLVSEYVKSRLSKIPNTSNTIIVTFSNDDFKKYLADIEKHSPAYQEVLSTLEKLGGDSEVKSLLSTLVYGDSIYAPILVKYNNATCRDCDDEASLLADKLLAHFDRGLALNFSGTMVCTSETWWPADNIAYKINCEIK